MQPTHALRQYLNALRAIRDQAQATEELSYHHALLQLLRALDPTAHLIHEPKRTVVGRPDFILLKNGAPAGSIEAEAFETDLDRLTGHAKTQTDTFKQNLDNFLLTNFVEFRLYRGGECVMAAKLSVASASPPTSRLHDAEATPRVSAPMEEAVLQLLHAFLSAAPLPIRTPHELAVHLARRTRQLKQILHATLEAQLKQPPDASLELRNLYHAFQETLLPDLRPEQFADLYAQTIAYGLFAARCQAAFTHAADARTPFTRAHAAGLIPPSNPFLRRLFQQLAAHDLEPELAWIADDLAQLLHHAAMPAILSDFGNRLAKEDPIVHFYEDFLQQYDPALRELRGVYYTPEPVVQFLVRAVDRLLQTDFGKPLGVAAPTALLLDPACGTGSFLYELVEQIHRRAQDAYGAGAWQDYVAQHLLPRLFGFELLVAPYAIAHLKLALQLQQLGYRFQPNERLGVYLTNTLEQAVKRTELLLGEFIAREANDAAHIKREKPILVVLGNPPYSGHSANRSRVGRTLTWIGELLEDYKRVDGQPLHEKNPKWLQDDYVKFIRWAQWRIERTGEGILAFITNHAYLDNPTFRGMRASLLRSFDRLYILNLHGNARRKETAPDGSPDENVFDIQQGVALLIAVKNPNARESSPTTTASSSVARNRDPSPTDCDSSSRDRDPSPTDSNPSSTDSDPSSTDSNPSTRESATERNWEASSRVFYYDLWGRREAKYAFLREQSLASIKWTPLTPRPPLYLFVPQDASLQEEYERGWRIPAIFPTHSVGIVTARDNLTIHRTREEVWRVVCRLVEQEPETAREHFGIGGDLKRVRRLLQDLRQAGVPDVRAQASIQPILYRPFDVRYTFYTGVVNGFHERPRPEVMRHLLARENLALIVGRSGAATGDNEWNIVFVSRQIVDLNLFRRGGGEVYPLYLYDEAEAQGELWAEGRRANLAQEFLDELAFEASPESVLAYIYAVLHAPSYRARYAEFLRRDFPRIPLPPNRDVFDRLAVQGQELIALHLLEHPDLAIPLCKFPVPGDHTVVRVRFDGERVWMNATQYFEPVSEAVWAVRIGGYPVCEKWLSDRKGHRLTLEEILTYQRVVSALAKTIALQAQIDAVCRQAWGW